MQFLSEPSSANWIALAALAIAIFSAIYSRISALTSRDALTHAENEARRTAALEFEERRTKLLALILEEQEMLRNFKFQVGILKSRFDNLQPEYKNNLDPIQDIVHFYHAIEHIIADSSSRYSMTKEFAQDTDYSILLKLMAEQESKTVDTKQLISSCSVLLPPYNEIVESLSNNNHRP